MVPEKINYFTVYFFFPMRMFSQGFIIGREFEPAIYNGTIAASEKKLSIKFSFLVNPPRLFGCEPLRGPDIAGENSPNVH